MVTNGLPKLIKDTLSEALRTYYHKAQSNIRSVVYRVHEQVMFDLLRKGGIDETLAAHIVKFPGTEAAPEWLSKIYWIQEEFYSPYWNISGRKTEPDMDDNETAAAKAAKL